MVTHLSLVVGEKPLLQGGAAFKCRYSFRSLQIICAAQCESEAGIGSGWLSFGHHSPFSIAPCSVLGGLLCLRLPVSFFFLPH